MSETCAVCHKGKGPEKCEVCGFSDNGVIYRSFPIPEDAQNWLDTVVKLYRAQWEKAELLAELEEKNKKIIELEAQKKEQTLLPPLVPSVPILLHRQENFFYNWLKKNNSNFNKKRIFWLIFSIILDGIIGGLYFASYNKMGLIALISDGAIFGRFHSTMVGGAIGGAIGSVIFVIGFSSDIKDMMIDIMSDRMRDRMDRILRIMAVPVVVGFIGLSIFFGAGSSVIVLKIVNLIFNSYGLFANLSSVVIGVIIGALMGLIGFLVGFYSAKLLEWST